MTFGSFLENELPVDLPYLAFFTPHGIWRSLFYRKMKHVVEQKGDEFCFHWFCDTPFDHFRKEILPQRTLFSGGICHCLCLQESDLTGAEGKQWLSALSKLSCSGGWPVVFVGTWKITAMQKRQFPLETVWIPEPRVDHSWELAQVLPFLRPLPGLEALTIDQLAKQCQITDGDVTQAVWRCLQNVLTDVAWKEVRNTNQDLFSFVRRLVHTGLSPRDMLVWGDDLLEGGEDWYPFLGMVHRGILETKWRNMHPLCEMVTCVDNHLKHFYPSAKQWLIWDCLLGYMRQTIDTCRIQKNGSAANQKEGG